MEFKGILLDIDNTLYDFDYAQSKALEKVFEFLSDEFEIDYDTVKSNFYKAREEIQEQLWDTGAAHNRLLYFQRMFENLDMNSLKYSLKPYNLYWDTFIENMNVFDGVYEFFEKFREQKMCFVTDMLSDIQFRKVIKLGLEKYVNLMVTSEESGKDKPSPKGFLLALKKLGLTADEVYMIGDNYERDIIGVAKLGIKSFWLDRSNSSEPDNKLITRVENFKEIMDALNK